ncbi:MAG: hypothetical protein LBI03_07615 [Clostridiales bacterium]|nr:hypothetical protein [Clostridiales bacterium]
MTSCTRKGPIVPNNFQTPSVAASENEIQTELPSINTIKYTFPLEIQASTIAAGGKCTFVIKSDDSLWEWGQLGNGTGESPIPVKIMDSVVSVSTDDDYILALKSDGSLWVWGPQFNVPFYQDNHEIEISYNEIQEPIKVMDGIKQPNGQLGQSLTPDGITEPIGPIMYPDLSQLVIPPECEPYTSVIYAYAMLEKSGYTMYYNDVIGDSSLPSNGGMGSYNFGDKPKLMYALYDINKDGSPELFIGALESISGIYTLKNGVPVSVLQLESRESILLRTDNNGNCIIEHLWRHMDYSEEFFYTIDKSNELITLDKLYVIYRERDENGQLFDFYYKEVNGEQICITEEEHDELINKYDGYEYSSDEENRQKINLTWGTILPDD